LTKEEKKQQVAEWQERLQSVKSAVLTDFRGLNVAQMTELRNKLREQEVEYEVAKNTLLRIAATNIGQEELHEYLTGPTGIGYSYKDAVAPAKALNSFAKENEALKFKAALLEGKIIDAQQVKNVANLPGREELLSRLLASFQSPLIGFIGVLQGNIRRLLNVLEAIKQQKST
jgi:large subunit ribosomal protein L10